MQITILQAYWEWHNAHSRNLSTLIGDLQIYHTKIPLFLTSAFHQNWEQINHTTIQNQSVRESLTNRRILQKYTRLSLGRGNGLPLMYKVITVQLKLSKLRKISHCRMIYLLSVRLINIGFHLVLEIDHYSLNLVE